MANNKSLQFLRGSSAQRKASSDKLLPGQPFYETDTNKLYVGGANTSLNVAEPLFQSMFERLDNLTGGPLYLHRTNVYENHSRHVMIYNIDTKSTPYTTVADIPSSSWLAYTGVETFTPIAFKKWDRNVTTGDRGSYIIYAMPDGSSGSPTTDLRRELVDPISTTLSDKVYLLAGQEV